MDEEESVSVSSATDNCEVGGTMQASPTVQSVDPREAKMLSGQEDEEELLCCNICMERFDEAAHRPKLLQCHHTFCLRCLTQCVLHNATKGGHTIPCPTCRKLTNIKKGVAALQDNYYLQPYIRRARRFSQEVFYSDGESSEEESPETRKVTTLWCETCLKVASPVCIAQHASYDLVEGTNRLKVRLNTALDRASQALTKQIILLETQQEFLVMVEQACTVGLVQQLEESIHSLTLALSFTRSQLEALAAVPQPGSKDPASLVQALQQAEKRLGEAMECTEPISSQLAIMTAMRNCSIAVQLPGEKDNSRDSISFVFKMQELTDEEEKAMTFMLYQMLQKKNKVTNAKPGIAPKAPDSSWHQVERSRGGKKNSQPDCGSMRARSKDVALKQVASKLSSSSSRAQSMDCLIFRRQRAPTIVNPHLGISKQNLRCYFDLTVNNEPLGRVIIQLCPEIAPKMCSNFVALCIGHEGFGYKGSRIFKAHPNDHIIGGDFVKNDGSGGHSIYKKGLFVADDSGILDEMGAVRMRGMGTDEASGARLVGSQFHIWVGKRVLRSYRRTLVIGSVVQGIEICRKVSCFKSVNNSQGNYVIHDKVVVSACGKL